MKKAMVVLGIGLVICCTLAGCKKKSNEEKVEALMEKLGEAKTEKEAEKIANEIDRLEKKTEKAQTKEITVKLGEPFTFWQYGTGPGSLQKGPQKQSEFQVTFKDPVIDKYFPSLRKTSSERTFLTPKADQGKVYFGIVAKIENLGPKESGFWPDIELKVDKGYIYSLGGGNMEANLEGDLPQPISTVEPGKTGWMMLTCQVPEDAKPVEISGKLGEAFPGASNYTKFRMKLTQVKKAAADTEKQAELLPRQAQKKRVPGVSRFTASASERNEQQVQQENQIGENGQEDDKRLRAKPNTSTINRTSTRRSETAGKFAEKPGESIKADIRTGSLEYDVVDFTETASKREGWKSCRFTIQVRNVSDELVRINGGSLYALSDGQKHAASRSSGPRNPQRRPPGCSHLTPGELVRPRGYLPPGYSVIYQHDIEVPALAPKVDFYLLTPDGRQLEVKLQKRLVQVEALPRQSRNELAIGDAFKVESRAEVALAGLEYYTEKNQFLPELNDFRFLIRIKNLTTNDIDTSEPLLYWQLFGEDGYTAYTRLGQVTIPPLFEKIQPLNPPLKMDPGKDYSLLVYMLGMGKNSEEPAAYWLYRFKAETKGVTEGKTTTNGEISENNQSENGQPNSAEPKSVEVKILADLLKGEKLLVGPSKKEVQLVENQPLFEKGIGVMQKIANHIPQYKHIQSWAFGVVPGNDAFGSLTEFGGSVVVGQEILQKHSLDEIAFVIGHEMAHCVLEHKGKPDLNMPLSKIVLWFPEEKLSREQELQADKHAVIFMDRACFEVTGASQYLGSLAKTIDEISESLPTAEHPPVSERIDNVIRAEQEQKGRCTAEAISSIELIPNRSLYKVGDTITATFTIRNKSGGCIHMRALTVKGTLNGECPDGICPDFTSRRGISLCSGDSYQYSGELKLEKPGAYHFFAAYEPRYGAWNTSIQTVPGVSNTKDIQVGPAARQEPARREETVKEKIVEKTLDTVFDQVFKKKK